MLQYHNSIIISSSCITISIIIIVYVLLLLLLPGHSEKCRILEIQRSCAESRMLASNARKKTAKLVGVVYVYTVYSYGLGCCCRFRKEKHAWEG